MAYFYISWNVLDYFALGDKLIYTKLVNKAINLPLNFSHFRQRDFRSIDYNLLLVRQLLFNLIRVVNIAGTYAI
jgi:hypothetical protein